jgi:pimeloyl-ACP methyl ester carboxylesterase
MTRRMKDCRAVTVPGVGHAPSLAEPESLAAIESLLASVT